MILVRDLAHLTQEVHVVDTAKLIFVEETDESLQLNNGKLLNHFLEYCQKGLCRYKPNVGHVGILEQLNGLLFVHGIDFRVDLLIDSVTVVNCFVGLASEVADEVAHWNFALVVL